MSEIRVGMFPPQNVVGGDPEVLAGHLEAMVAAGLDHVAAGDHISFFVGVGVDGLISAASLASLNTSLDVLVSVYILSVRNPVLVARQISTISTFAPGRLILGVGVGGEDRHEIEICGVDPATRGKRMDEALTALRALLTGSPTDVSGEFFNFEGATIIPPPRPMPPILVGGRSDAAIQRTGRLGDGWIATWVSARRFSEAAAQIDEIAAENGRESVLWRHAIQTWCGFGDSRSNARSYLSTAMQNLYRLPFEKFEKWSPFGTPHEVAEELLPYAEAGCTTFNLLPQSADPRTSIEGAAEIKTLLNKWAGTKGPT